MIKLYRKTFIISCIISLTSFILSVTFEVFRRQVDILLFFENYSIGVACSGALVAVTAFLQFQSEFNHAFRPLAVFTSSLITVLSSAIIYENDPSTFEREFEASPYDCINSATKRAGKIDCIICLSKTRQRVFEEISIYLCLLRFDFFQGKSRSDSVKAVTDSKRVFKLIDLALKAFPDCIEKEEICESKADLEHYLNALKA